MHTPLPEKRFTKETPMGRQRPPTVTSLTGGTRALQLKFLSKKFPCISGWRQVACDERGGAAIVVSNLDIPEGKFEPNVTKGVYCMYKKQPD